MHLWGIDLGGTKIEGVVLESRENPQPLARLRIATEAHLGYDHICGQVKKLVDLLAESTGLQPEYIGIGHPGTLDHNVGAMKNANTTSLNGRPFDRDLEKLLGVPVRLANDANCFAVAEALLGSAHDTLPNAEAVFGVILGTGVGGGLVVHGKVLNGRQGLGGEWGHNVLDENGDLCYCGKRGCVETVFSGPALERFYEKTTGQKRHLKEIVERAENGDDPAAVATIDRLVQYFGKAIAVIINIIDPDIIVLGGGVGNIGRLYTDGVAEARKNIFDTRPERRIETIFLKPKLGDSAGVFGAALL